MAKRALSCCTRHGCLCAFVTANAALAVQIWLHQRHSLILARGIRVDTAALVRSSAPQRWPGAVGLVQATCSVQKQEEYNERRNHSIGQKRHLGQPINRCDPPTASCRSFLIPISTNA